MKLRDIIIVLAIAISIFLVTRLVIRNFVVEGGSMDPNLAEKQWILVNMLDNPERGDIIVFHRPSDRKVLIKRVIGIPEETIKIENGEIRIDNKLLDESEYIDVVINDSENGTWDLGEGQYFVLGDNRNKSSDSPDWGLLPESDIIGTAWLRIWPLSSWGFAPNYSPGLEE